MSAARHHSDSCVDCKRQLADTDDEVVHSTVVVAVVATLVFAERLSDRTLMLLIGGVILSAVIAYQLMPRRHLGWWGPFGCAKAARSEGPLLKGCEKRETPRKIACSCCDECPTKVVAP